MTTSAPDLTLCVTEEITIAAPLEEAWAALLARLGPRLESPSGDDLDMTIEPWPGGRWFRDLGDNQGHLWGHVQVIKPPRLLEIVGPLFMSYPAQNHLQCSMEEVDGGTVLRLHHQAFGVIDPAHREGVTTGWNLMAQGVKQDAEHD